MTVISGDTHLQIVREERLRGEIRGLESALSLVEQAETVEQARRDVAWLLEWAKAREV